jgi:hypothetical protein
MAIFAVPTTTASPFESTAWAAVVLDSVVPMLLSW